MSKMVEVRLTVAQLRALLACAGEGFEGLASDYRSARDYGVSIPAAERALEILRKALAEGKR